MGMIKTIKGNDTAIEDRFKGLANRRHMRIDAKSGTTCNVIRRRTVPLANTSHFWESKSSVSIAASPCLKLGTVIGCRHCQEILHDQHIDLVPDCFGQLRRIQRRVLQDKPIPFFQQQDREWRAGVVAESLPVLVKTCRRRSVTSNVGISQ